MDNQSLKDDIYNLIYQKLNMSILNQTECDMYKTKFYDLFQVIDEPINEIEQKIIDADTLKEDNLQKELFDEIKCMTDEKFFGGISLPEIHIEFDTSGNLWLDSECEYCYTRDEFGHCHNHNGSYEETLHIYLPNDILLYSHYITDEANIQHTNEKVYISPSDNLNIQIDECNWKLLTDSPELFNSWIYNVYEIIYNVKLHNDCSNTILYELESAIKNFYKKHKKQKHQLKINR